MGAVIRARRRHLRSRPPVGRGWACWRGGGIARAPPRRRFFNAQRLGLGDPASIHSCFLWFPRGPASQPWRRLWAGRAPRTRAGYSAACHGDRIPRPEQGRRQLALRFFVPCEGAQYQEGREHGGHGRIDVMKLQPMLPTGHPAAEEAASLCSEKALRRALAHCRTREGSSAFYKIPVPISTTNGE